jgi:hypothetical protein
VFGITPPATAVPITVLINGDAAAVGGPVMIMSIVPGVDSEEAKSRTIISVVVPDVLLKLNAVLLPTSNRHQKCRVPVGVAGPGISFRYMSR